MRIVLNKLLLHANSSSPMKFIPCGRVLAMLMKVILKVEPHRPPSLTPSFLSRSYDNVKHCLTHLVDTAFEVHEVEEYWLWYEEHRDDEVSSAKEEMSATSGRFMMKSPSLKVVLGGRGEDRRGGKCFV